MPSSFWCGRECLIILRRCNLCMCWREDKNIWKYNYKKYSIVSEVKTYRQYYLEDSAKQITFLLGLGLWPSDFAFMSWIYTWGAGRRKLFVFLTEWTYDGGSLGYREYSFYGNFFTLFLLILVRYFFLISNWISNWLRPFKLIIKYIMQVAIVWSSCPITLATLAKYR